MGWSEYARSRMPLKLVFILIAAVAVNLMIIEGFKALLIFDHVDNLNTAQLSSIDNRYEGCTLIDTYVDKDENHLPWENYFTFHLLENSQGEKFLAVIENHFLFPRARYWEKLSVSVPEFASNEAPLFGEYSRNVGYNCMLAPDETIEYVHVHGQKGFGTPLLLVPMLIAEYVGFVFLFRKEEIM